MKKIIIVFMFFGCKDSTIAANLYEVSPQAKVSFKHQYPGALYTAWETLEVNNTYGVRFVQSNKSLVAYYAEDVTSIGFATFNAVDKLPANIKEALDSMFTGCKISGAAELVLPDMYLLYFNAVNKKEALFIATCNKGKIKQKRKVPHA